MAIAPASPITGGAQTGFTAPTYTFVPDQAPAVNGKQWAVVTLGGTQTGVTTHTGSAPFTFTWWKALTYKVIGKPNPVTNVINNVPVNIQKLVIRKAVVPLAGQPAKNAEWNSTFAIPAGSDTADAANIRAMVSLGVGFFSANSAGVGDTLVTNIS